MVDRFAFGKHVNNKIYEYVFKPSQESKGTLILREILDGALNII